MPNDQELLKNARIFDLTALGSIYDIYSPKLYRYAMRLLGNDSMAEDCVADTFSRFLKSLRSGQGPDTHLQAYLYRIAHNWITDHYRRNPVISVELDETLQSENVNNPESQMEINFQQWEIRSALRTLTPDQRQVIILRFIEGWQNEEVANAMQKPIGAIKALQHRALETLRQLLFCDQKVSQNESK